MAAWGLPPGRVAVTSVAALEREGADPADRSLQPAADRESPGPSLVLVGPCREGRRPGAEPHLHGFLF